MSITSEINKIIEDLEELKRKAENGRKTANDLLDKARDFLGDILFQYFLGDLQAAVNLAIYALEFIINEAERYLKLARCFFQFFDLETVWRTDVAKKFSDIHGALSNRNTGGGVWTGKAYDAYTGRTANQLTAISQLSSASTKVADSLQGTGIAYTTFLVSTTSVLAGLLVWTIAAIAAAPPTAGASTLAAAAKVLEAVLIIAGLLGALIALVLASRSSLGSVTDVKTFGNASVFPPNSNGDPTWPDASPAF